MAQSGFTLDDLIRMGPDEVTRRKKLAEAMLAQSQDFSPIASPLQGFARLAQALTGAIGEWRANKAETEGRASANKAFASLFGGGDMPSSIPTSSTSSSGGGNYRDAIAGIESRGNYKAIGPETKTGDRAYGKYQMMGKNIGPWTEAALGRRLSPHEFLSSPEAQDATFDHIFGGYVSKYGPEGAAQAWFGGPGSVGKTGRKDMLGTSVGDYGKRFMRGIGANNTLAGGEAGDQLQASLVQPAPADQVSPLFGQVTPQLRANGIQPQQAAETLAPVQTAETVPGQEIGAGYDATSPIIRALMGLSGPDTASRGGQYPAAPGTPEGDAFAAQAASGPSMEQLMTAMNNPWASEGQQRLAGALLSDRLKRSDPEYQLELKTKQAQLDRLKNPQPGYRQLTPDEVTRLGLDPKKAYQVSIAGDDAGKISQIGGGDTTVNVGAGETQYDKTMGEGYAKRFNDAQAQAQQAQGALDSLSVMKQVMADPGFYSGAGGDTIANLKRLGASIGLDPNGIDSIETFASLSNKAVLDSMGGSLGTGFSNADRDFVIGQVPNLGTTPQGNMRRIEIMEKVNRRKIEIAGLARKYAAEHGGRIDAGFDDALAEYAKANPLFPAKSEASPTGEIAKPQTQDEFDALPSGTIYIDPDDGKQYRKP